MNQRIPLPTIMERLLRSFTRPHRAQVFILATLLLVVYTVSIMAVISELTLDKNNDDEVDLTGLLDEFLVEMRYQVQLTLFNYTNEVLTSAGEFISNLQSFQQTFATYCSLKGVQASFNIQPNTFVVVGKTTGDGAEIIASPELISATVQTSVTLQSTESSSQVTGVFSSFYGVEFLISPADNTVLLVRQVTSDGEVVKYLSGATFSSPAALTDLGNGGYQHLDDLSDDQIRGTLASGIVLVS